MPTATDIDNRPVAIGKWPRLRGSNNRNAAIISTNHALRRNRANNQSNSLFATGDSDTSYERAELLGGHSENVNTPSGKHSDWCTLENCVHNCDEDSSNPCIDVLLNPELLQEFYGDKCLTSANPLLEFCLDGGLSRKLPSSTPISEAVPVHPPSAFANNETALGVDLVSTTLAASDLVSNTLTSSPTFETKHAQSLCTTNTTSTTKPENVISSSLVATSLLSHCSLCSQQVQTCSDKSQFVSQLRMHLRQTGCDINVQDSQGFTALHHLIQGCSKENFAPVMEAAELLLNQLEPCRINPDVYDLQDHNSPLTSLHMLLDQNLPQSSLVKLARLMLAHDFDVNHINGHDRTLLTYSVSKGDLYLDLTKLLLNHGALILPARSNIVRDRSAFTWLVKSLMTEQSLDGHKETLLLLCQNMAEVNGPEAMRSHTLSTMIHLGHTASVMAPLFMQLRSLIVPFWSQPLDLVHLCRNSIRRSLGPKNISLGVTQLNLPPSLSHYLHYYFQ